MLFDCALPENIDFGIEDIMIAEIFGSGAHSLRIGEYGLKFQNVHIPSIGGFQFIR